MLKSRIPLIQYDKFIQYVLIQYDNFNNKNDVGSTKDIRTSTVNIWGKGDGKKMLTSTQQIPK